jgi:LysM repeat protein
VLNKLTNRGKSSMNKEEPYRDQAERLKQRIQKINEKVEVSEEFPPREQLHRQKKKKTKWKLKYPVIRLLAVVFILLPIIIFSVISTRNSGRGIIETEKTSGSSVGYETINLEKDNDAEVENTEKSEDVKQEEKKDTSVNDSEEQSKQLDGEAVQPAAASPADMTSQQVSSNQSTIKQQPSDKNSDTQTQSPNKETATSNTKVIKHTVQTGETLFSLAKRYYNSQSGMDIIKRANNLTSDQINVGQVLKIPLNN